MEKLFYLKTAITVIEKCITDKVAVEQIAKECYVSPRQLYRDFYSLTGHTINEYVRKRRLSRALSLLRYTNMSIIDIAYQCGYSSQAAFCKTLKYYLDMTASEYRNNSIQYFFPVFNCDNYRQIEVLTETIPETISIHFYHRQLNGIENRALDYWFSIAPNYTGRIFGRNEKQYGKQFCYELRVEYSEDTMSLIQNSRFKVSSVNSPMRCAYATTIVKNNLNDINLAWNYLYTYWLTHSMFEQDSNVYFEEFILRNSIVNKLILYLPVIPRINYFKINIISCEDRLFLVSTKKGSKSEKLASDQVVNFIAQQYPYLLETQKEYYVSKNNDSYTCGIRLNEKRYIMDDGSLSLLTIPEGVYAVIEGSNFGGNEYETILMQWVNENGFKPLDMPFTIYDVSSGNNHNELMLKSYIRLKWQ